MNAKSLKIAAAIVILAGLVLLARGFPPRRAERPLQVLPANIPMKPFQGKNPPYNFTFEYPEAWRVNERGYRGDYDMVEVMDVSNKNALTMPGMFITKKNLRAGDSEEGLMKSWLGEEGRYRNFKVTSRGNAEAADQKALRSEYSYALSLPLWAGGAQEVRIKKEQIIFIRGDASFQITFVGSEDQFRIYRPVFDRMLQTLKFRD